jgi:TRAP-type C4-dicarboxylate transport system substrate-binding protein
MLMSVASFDRLPIALQAVVQAAAAKVGARFTDVTRSQDEALLGGLFAKHGVQTVPASAGFRSDLFEAARVARQLLGSQLVPMDLINRVQNFMADYRAEQSAH